MFGLPPSGSFSILLANRSYLTEQLRNMFLPSPYEFQYSLSESKLFNLFRQEFKVTKYLQFQYSLSESKLFNDERLYSGDDAATCFSILLANRSYLTAGLFGPDVGKNRFQYSLSESKLFNP